MEFHIHDDDYFMLHIPLRQAQLQLAAFAIHLAMGNNIYCKRITLGTIKRYINDVATMTALHCQVDIRKDSPTDNGVCKPLQAVYKELEQWEDEPKRREPCTPDMVKEALKRAKSAPTDSLVDILGDWMVLGIFAGLRLDLH